MGYQRLRSSEHQQGTVHNIGRHGLGQWATGASKALSTTPAATGTPTSGPWGRRGTHHHAGGHVPPEPARFWLLERAGGHLPSKAKSASGPVPPGPPPGPPWT